MSESLQKCVLACQPFKDGVATLICSGCRRLMAFPSGASKVRCAGCSAITSGFRINCTSCKEPLKIFLKDKESKCGKCGYVFTSLTTFKIPGTSGPGGAAKLNTADLIAVKLQAEEKLSPVAKDGVVTKLNVTKPLSSHLSNWEELLGIPNLAQVGAMYKNELIDLSLTAEQAGIETGGTLTLMKREGGQGTQAGGHIFLQAQFNQPTNCAYCRKFIWGLYNQGKRCNQCAAPVHHRCAALFTQICEAALRQSMGLSIAQLGEDEDDTLGGEPMEGMPIPKEDVREWETLLSETVSPENDAKAMSIFDKFEDLSDEDIAKMWKKYDRDGNGELDLDEMRFLVLDLLGTTCAEGEEEERNLRATIERVTKAMDTNRDGAIQLEEFQAFYRAKRDSSFLQSLQGAQLSRSQIEDLWAHYDEDQSGTMEPEEVLKLLHDCVMLQQAGQDKQKTMRMYRGKLESLLAPGSHITWDEFCSTILPIIQPTISAKSDAQEKDEL